MTARYSRIEPNASGLLEVGDGQRVYRESCGNPAGKTAVVLHGGPGSGCSPWFHRLFDPNASHVILFDQRNCGHSLPHGGDPQTSLAHNATAHLIADIERLRRFLRIDRRLVLGGS
jgi:proline iminopeptidase